MGTIIALIVIIALAAIAGWNLTEQAVHLRTYKRHHKQQQEVKQPQVPEAEKMEELRQALEQKQEQVVQTPNPQAALLVAQLQNQLQKEVLALEQAAAQKEAAPKVVLQETVVAEKVVKPKRKKYRPRKKKAAKQI